MDLKWCSSEWIGLTKTGHTISLGEDDEWCTCLSFIFRRRCKHMDVKKIIKDKKVAGIRYFKSNLEAMNDLFSGEPYNSDQIFAIYAESETGKTLFLMQEAYYLTTQGYNVMWLDTEGGFIEFLNDWYEVMESRFGEQQGMLDWQPVNGTKHLLEFFGYNVEMKTDGKVDLNIKKAEKLEDTEIYKTMKKNKIDFIILDSITDPLRAFMSKQQDYPAKADCAGLIFRTLKLLMTEFKCPVVTTNHASFNPANPFEVHAKLRGGSTVYYYSKKIVYIDKRAKKDLDMFRRFWLVRSANEKSWSRVTGGKVDDLGYNDITDDQLDDILTTKEKSRL